MVFDVCSEQNTWVHLGPFCRASRDYIVMIFKFVSSCRVFQLPLVFSVSLCSEVTLRGWRDVKFQELTSFSSSQWFRVGTDSDCSYTLVISDFWMMTSFFFINFSFFIYSFRCLFICLTIYSFNSSVLRSYLATQECMSSALTVSCQALRESFPAV